MKKLLSFFIFTLFIFIPAYSQQYSPEIEKGIVNMYSQLLVFPQEKIYLQTDKPYYINGEKIFFRVFMLHASTLKPAYISRYVYVELVNPEKDVVLRQQIIPDEEKMFYGNLDLPEDLPEGNYIIRAYTRYMENTGEKYFYSRPIFIADPNTNKTNLETSFEFINNREVKVGLRFLDVSSKKVKNPDNIELKFNGSIKNIPAKFDTEGWVYEKFNLKGNEKNRTLLAEYKDVYEPFKKYIYIPYKENFPEVSFYPEGGNIIAGQSNRIAFKALLPNGQAAEIKGMVFNSENEHISSFTTLHEGMGVFTLQAEKQEKYYVHYTYKDENIRINLPEIKTNTFSLQAVWQEDNLTVSVRKPEQIPQQTYYLLIHRQGVPTYFDKWDFTTNEVNIQKSEIQAGVSHLMFLSEDMQVISERLIFNPTNEKEEIRITTNKQNYKPREKVILDITVNNSSVDTLQTSLAISVTDDKDIQIDTTTNIVAEILLVSELEGHIQNPLFYFQPTKQAFQAADLLMMTHGWRRYYVAEALQEQLQHPEIKPEISQAFCGILKNKRGKPYKNAKIKMTAIGQGFSEVRESNDMGEFIFDNLEFPDSTAFHFLSFTNEKTKDIEIVLNKIEYPSVNSTNYRNQPISVELNKVDFNEYIQKADLKYTWENGRRNIELPEVTVRTARKRKEENRIDNHVAGDIKPDKWVSYEDIKEYPPATMEELLRRALGAIEISPERGVIIRGEIASFVVNGLPVRTNYKNLEEFVRVEEIKQVDIFIEMGKTAVFGGGPTIAFTTLSSNIIDDENEGKNIQLILPLGYQQPIEFYAPTYDTTEKLNDPTPDLRSTIYWKPNVLIEKENKQSLEFYASDTQTSYSIVVEGITNNKKLIYYKKDAIIKVE